MQVSDPEYDNHEAAMGMSQSADVVGNQSGVQIENNPKPVQNFPTPGGPVVASSGGGWSNILWIALLVGAFFLIFRR